MWKVNVLGKFLYMLLKPCELQQVISVLRCIFGEQRALLSDGTVGLYNGNSSCRARGGLITR